MEVNMNSFHHLSKRILPPVISLQVVDIHNEVVFETVGKWLYPLFELETFVKEQDLNTSLYFLHDRIAGKAAAALTSRLGFKHVKAEMMSALAASLYDMNKVHYSYEHLVDKIYCQTETIFEHIDDIEEIYTIVNNRRAIS